MRVTLQEELDTLQASLSEEHQLVLRALRGSINSLRETAHFEQPRLQVIELLLEVGNSGHYPNLPVT